MSVQNQEDKAQEIHNDGDHVLSSSNRSSNRVTTSRQVLRRPEIDSENQMHAKFQQEEEIA